MMMILLCLLSTLITFQGGYMRQLTRFYSLIKNHTGLESVGVFFPSTPGVFKSFLGCVIAFMCSFAFFGFLIARANCLSGWRLPKFPLDNTATIPTAAFPTVFSSFVYTEFIQRLSFAALSTNLSLHFSRVLSVLNTKRPVSSCPPDSGKSKRAVHSQGAMPTNEYMLVNKSERQKSSFADFPESLSIIAGKMKPVKLMGTQLCPRF